MRLLLSSTLLISILIISNLQISSCQESGQIKLGGPPDLSDEESSSFHMPERLKCDGCKIIAHMFFESFRQEEKKVPKGKLLSESQIIDVADGVCSSEFQEYGITEFNGEKRMKGPGLETEKLPGVSQAGGKWPVRLQQFCLFYVGELGEDYIYRKYRRASENQEQWSQIFRKYLCEESGSQFSHCRQKKSEL